VRTSRWSWRTWLALAAVVLVLAMTLTFDPPWLFQQLAELLDGHVSGWLIARVLNVLLFVPLGIAIGVWRRPRLLLGAVALSVGVELTQHLLPERSPDVWDVVTNTAGALLGYGAVRVWRRRRWGSTDRAVADGTRGDADRRP
jgi:glycopeptide antibiotics resistance protein